MKSSATPLQQPLGGEESRPSQLMALEPGDAGGPPAPEWLGPDQEGSPGVALPRGSRRLRRRPQPWQVARACALLAGGVALVPTPAPGILLILWGLKGLGRGFHWVRRIEVPIRRRLRRTRVGRMATGIG